MVYCLEIIVHLKLLLRKLLLLHMIILKEAFITAHDNSFSKQAQRQGDVRTGGLFVDVRDVDTLAIIAAEPPAMEGAFEAGALDEPPHGQVGPHVRAVGVDRVRPPILATKHC